MPFLCFCCDLMCINISILPLRIQSTHRTSDDEVWGVFHHRNETFQVFRELMTPFSVSEISSGSLETSKKTSRKISNLGSGTGGKRRRWRKGTCSIQAIQAIIGGGRRGAADAGCPDFASTGRGQGRSSGGTHGVIRFFPLINGRKIPFRTLVSRGYDVKTTCLSLNTKKRPFLLRLR